MGRSFANLHIKSSHFDKTIEALKALSEGSGGKSSNSNQAVSDDAQSEQTQETVMYISSNESWISVLHDYFVWGTVKKAGKALSRLIEEPVMTVGFINDEIFELSIFEKGDLQAERIFCHPLVRDEYGLQEQRLQDYLRVALDIREEAFDDFIRLTSPAQAVDKLSELVGMSLWSDFEWLPYEEELKDRSKKYEFA
ncbi:hypothetical protein [Paenibacillus sp. HGF5]|uniref:hypothetical protein n=1 Tax=Paenibacillus sp. HGF5 TaxID=908341 RepID=UPI000207279B|nr:hypothetical protein [Paenibacillus sp. HGF5]EGG34822.1 conserved domain protein [Paenibacillus sp. HGF5]